MSPQRPRSSSVQLSSASCASRARRSTSLTLGGTTGGNDGDSPHVSGFSFQNLGVRFRGAAAFGPVLLWFGIWKHAGCPYVFSFQLERAQELGRWQKEITSGWRMPVKTLDTPKTVLVQPDLCTCGAVISRYQSSWRCNGCNASGQNVA
jgi:hypothetical protein